MALFFDKHVQFPRQSAAGGVRVHHAVEWHRKQAILAVASKNADTDSNGSVSFYVEEVRKEQTRCYVTAGDTPPVEATWL